MPSTVRCARLRLRPFVALFTVALSLAAALGLGNQSAGAATPAKSSRPTTTVPGGLGPTTMTAAARTWTQAITGADGSLSQATVTWDPTTHRLTLGVATGLISTGYCVTTYFDWGSHGHHDARALRDCRAGDTLIYSFPDSNTSNLTGKPTRLGVCFAKADHMGTCLRGVGSVPRMNWTPWPNPERTTPCDLSWVRRGQDASLTTFIDPHSQRNQIESGGGC